MANDVKELVEALRNLVPGCDDPSDYTADDRVILKAAAALVSVASATAALSRDRDRAGEQKVVAEPVAVKTHGAWDGLECLEELPDETYLYAAPASSAPDDVRRMALEEAAEIAEDTSSSIGPVIAKAIRNLASAPPRASSEKEQKT
jgi:hypothetical protein